MTLKQLKNHWPSLLAFFGLIILIQAVGAYATFTSVHDWYPLLNKPVWSPPNWLFGPVWTCLYFLQAICGWLLWLNSRKESAQRPVFFCYCLQLFFNFAWSPLFFGLRHPVLGFIDISLLEIFALLTLYLSLKSNQKAVALMFVPYCLWVLFASFLNGAIVVLN